ncbi:sensor histidine kinase [Indiicoccus explosivorum]|uniref:sensor histidine kinase n=1 Tax=Indiicoccus explosivorum TaxID=1917864 RepID=UPI000B43D38A|nr:HAMP domain-containing sensor histidine kinase [Indiicoccus explosivorum]
MQKWLWLFSLSVLLMSLFALDDAGTARWPLLLVLIPLISVAGLILYSIKFDRKWFEADRFRAWTGEWPFEGKVLLLAATVFFVLLALDKFYIELFWELAYGYVFSFPHIPTLLIAIALSVLLLAAVIMQAVWLWEEYREPDRLIADMRDGITARFIGYSKLAYQNRKIRTQVLLLLTVVFFWGAGTAITVLYPPLLLVLVPASLLIGLPVLYGLVKRFGYLAQLIDGTDQLAAGRLAGDLPVRGKSVLAGHARALNTLKEGVRLSLSEQAKSERLKTELITNVSHDLRTPLTSIITYTDLLKNPSLPEEDRQSYVGILDRKSQRLKVLIEDLFEVSKMASGNMDLQRQKVDAAQLMQQALAEHEEDITESGLLFRVTAPERPLIIYADGQKWWRLMDNLILNAIKYALPGTRVYVSLKEEAGQAEFTIKNVTRHEIGTDTDELFERFKRGDTSRGTEGSGLGLAIAQSIAGLHGGNLRIDVDGDLFKVTVTMPAA